MSRTPDTTLAEGMQVGANLRLVRLLGQGGMGSVWLADHLTLQTQVAIKFVATEGADSSVFERFRREATAAAQLKHPHVIQVFDHGVTENGQPYIVMELLEGEDLATRLGRVGRLAPAEAVSVIGQAAKALSKAHASGIVHRDIKPENIFLSEIDGEVFVKVLDFGIAKSDDHKAKGLTSSGALIGTPYYMSPEQARSSKDVDHRADLWSLSVVAYHCLTGVRPFDGETLASVFVAIDRGIYSPPSGMVRALPASVDSWFAKALNHHPSCRFGSAKELARTFADAVEDKHFDGTAPPLRGDMPSRDFSDVSSVGEPGVQPPTLGGTAASAASAATSASRGLPPRRLMAAVGVLFLVTVAITIGVMRLTGASGDAPTSLASQTPAISLEPSAEVPPATAAAPPTASEESVDPATLPVASVPAASAATSAAPLVPVRPTPTPGGKSKSEKKHEPATPPPPTPAPSPPPARTSENFGF